VDDGLALEFAQYAFQLLAVADVTLDQRERTPGDLLDPRNRLRAAVAEIVEDDDFMAGLEQFHASMGTNIAGTAGDKNIHVSFAC
jgi:hypothetical protein